MTDLVVRPATTGDAEAALIGAHQKEGQLLPRELAEVRRHAPPLHEIVRYGVTAGDDQRTAVA